MQKYKVVVNLTTENKLEMDVTAIDIQEATILALQQAKESDWKTFEKLQTKAI